MAPPHASIQREHRHERLLWDLDRSDAFHAPLAFLLLLQELPLARYVAAVALRDHVLAHWADRLARDHLAADRCLDGDLEQLPRDDRLQLLGQPAPVRRGLAALD